MSELVNNLQSIYNIKLQIKDALGTDSDLFEDYPDLIEAAIGEGGGGTVKVDPWYGCKDIVSMVDEGLSSTDYYGSVITNNFNVTTDENDAIEAVEWNEQASFSIDGNDVLKTIHVIVNGDPHGIIGDATDIGTALNNFASLYNNINPILENATLTASEDPSEDGYDYLLEGDLYAWNLCNNYAQVTDVTENGFYPSSADGALGFNVDVQANTGEIEITNNGKYFAENENLDGWHYVKVSVPTSGITPSGTINISSNGTTDVTSYAYANVNVGIPSGYILPSGTKNITTNGNGIDVSSYANANVNVTLNSNNFTDLGTAYWFVPNTNPANLSFGSSSVNLVPITNQYFSHAEVIPLKEFVAATNPQATYYSIKPYFVDSEGQETLIGDNNYGFYDSYQFSSGAYLYLLLIMQIPNDANSNYSYMKYYSSKHYYDSNESNWIEDENPVAIGENSYCMTGVLGGGVRKWWFNILPEQSDDAYSCYENDPNGTHVYSIENYYITDPFTE